MGGSRVTTSDDPVIEYSVKDLLEDIRNNLRHINEGLMTKADKVEIANIYVRLNETERRLNENDTRWARLVGYVVGSGVVSGGVATAIAQVIK